MNFSTDISGNHARSVTKRTNLPTDSVGSLENIFVHCATFYTAPPTKQKIQPPTTSLNTIKHSHTKFSIDSDPFHKHPTKTENTINQ